MLASKSCAFSNKRKGPCTDEDSSISGLLVLPFCLRVFTHFYFSTLASVLYRVSRLTYLAIIKDVWSLLSEDIASYLRRSVVSLVLTHGEYAVCTLSFGVYMFKHYLLQ